jgi:hypothetical protein
LDTVLREAASLLPKEEWIAAILQAIDNGEATASVPFDGATEYDMLKGELISLGFTVLTASRAAIVVGL